VVLYPPFRLLLNGQSALTIGRVGLVDVYGNIVRPAYSISSGNVVTNYTDTWDLSINKSTLRTSFWFDKCVDVAYIYFERTSGQTASGYYNAKFSSMNLEINGKFPTGLVSSTSDLMTMCFKSNIGSVVTKQSSKTNNASNIGSLITNIVNYNTKSTIGSLYTGTSSAYGTMVRYILEENKNYSIIEANQKRASLSGVVTSGGRIIKARVSVRVISKDGTNYLIETDSDVNGYSVKDLPSDTMVDINVRPYGVNKIGRSANSVKPLQVSPMASYSITGPFTSESILS
jgi:hypothetical protein